jgi:CheY-like chemotaxis protein
MNKKRILIVDDDARNIYALTATLHAKGFSCQSCMSGEEALELLSSDEIVDGVLLDMMMPEMDGYETIPILRSMPHRKDILVIAVTAQAMKGDREKCLQAGADEYLPKPVDVDRLLQMLRDT